MPDLKTFLIAIGAQPHRTLAPFSIQGSKREMDRLTVLLACNVTGTELLKPVLCGNVMRQRAWGPKTGDRYVKWVKTKKAWMDKEVFHAWL